MLSNFISFISNVLHLVLGIGTPQKFPPPLPSDEERECFLLLKNKGDEGARQKLILHNLRLVSHIVRKYYASATNSGSASASGSNSSSNFNSRACSYSSSGSYSGANFSQEDLVSVGTLGLVKAVDSFSPENGARFATYASKCIQNEILMYFRSQKKLSAEVSLNETIDVDRDGNPLTYIDVISSDDNITDDVDLKLRSQKAIKLVQTVLNPRERQIIVMRYGLGGARALTQRECAERLRISRSYVSRIEKGALEKLRDAFTR